MEQFWAEIVASDELDNPLERLLASSQALTQHDDTPPPAKRRRTNHSFEDESHMRNDVPGEAQYSVLSHISVDLKYDLPTPPPSPPENEDSSDGRIKVNVRHVRPMKWNDHFLNFSLVEGHGKKQTTVGLSIRGDRLEELRSRLDHFEIASPVSANGSRSTFRESVWSDCFLSRQSSQSTGAFILEARIYWRFGYTAGLSKNPKLDKLLTDLIPQDLPRTSNLWSPQDFYENTYVPPRDLEVSSAIQSPSLDCDLYPFQKRAIHWLLQREGKAIDEKGRIADLKDSSTAGAFSSEAWKDATGEQIYVHRLFGEITRDPHSTVDNLFRLRGGILSEEMGLGKTVELISLILLNKRNSSGQTPESDIRRSAATLIITPHSILEQWQNEIRTHGPSLQFCSYQGIKNSKLDETELQELLASQDIVLTTYNVLANEIHYADEKPDRSLRHRKKYEPRRSPLVQMEWWRVCLDEAQMVESGVSNSAKVARLIPRINAWAVTGTPLRKDVSDLYGLLLFLGCEPYSRQDVWNRMIRNFKSDFIRVFSTIALRHSKAGIRDELHIPPQKRMVVTLPFTAVEEQNYAQLFQQMCEDCGLDETGAPIDGEWNPDSPVVVEKMRTWLTRLRQTCLHAEVGRRNRRALGHGDGPLRTIDEVLESLIEQNETALRVAERASLMSRMMRGHLHSFGKKPEPALAIYLGVSAEADRIVQECRHTLARQKVTGSDVQSTMKEVQDRGQDKEHETGIDEAAEDGTGRITAARSRLRSALEVQHSAYFFSATGYYQVKEDVSLTEPDSDRFRELEENETAAYESAKVIRKELLADVGRKTSKYISQILSNQPTTLPGITTSDHFRGIESRKVFEKLDTIAQLLNAQAEQYGAWREEFIKILSVKLIDQGEDDLDLTGEEYEESTRQQDEAYVYHLALRALLADRNCFVTGIDSFLIEIEMKEALKLATHGTRDQPEEKGHAPELTKELLSTRLKLKPSKKQDPPLSLRGIMTDLRSLLTALHWQEGDGRSRAATEAAIAEKALHEVQQFYDEQMKANTALEKELDFLRSTMNQRLEYYKSLQDISDQVRPLDEEATDEVDATRVAIELDKEAKQDKKVATLQTKKRFLSHLREDSKQGNEQQRTCVICTSTFEDGVLTVCGHQFCADCMQLWFNSHHSCPMCKRKLSSNEMHKVTYTIRDIQVIEESSHHDQDGSLPSFDEVGGSSQHAPSQSIYSSMNASVLNEIKNIDLHGDSFGVKVDTLARHLIWIRQNDPGSKSIIFSQYRAFLQVLARALKQFKIGYAEIGTPNGIQRFRVDPSAECFLLHAKANSSGLNLVNATHVFLCEPLINAAIELQAIARVHRIGQRRPTSVYMYLISDTVEEAIYEISVERRMAHMRRRRQRRGEGGGLAPPDPSSSYPSSSLVSRAGTPSATRLEDQQLDAANSLELQAAPLSKLLTKGQSGGEVVAKDDLWACLFGRNTSNTTTKLHPAGLARPAFLLSFEKGSNGGAELLADEVGRFLRAEAAEARRQVS